MTIELFAAIETHIARINAAGSTSASAESAGTSETRSKVARAREIETDLRLVVKTARQVARKIPNFQNTFKLPRGGMSYQEHVAQFIAAKCAARIMLN